MGEIRLVYGWTGVVHPDRVMRCGGGRSYRRYIFTNLNRFAGGPLLVREDERAPA